MTMMILAQRYARGALAAAGEGERETLVDQMEQFVACVSQNPSLSTVLTHPALAQERSTVVKAVANHLALGPVAHNVLGLLVQRGRTNLLVDVAQQMRALTDAAQGLLRAHVTSAMPLGEPEVRRLEQQLSERMGKPVRAQVQVDASLIGGMVCEVGELTFDSSLKNQLANLADRFGTRLS